MNRYIYSGDESYSLEEFEKASEAEIAELLRDQEILSKEGVIYH